MNNDVEIITIEPIKEPWEKFEEESAKAFSAFKTYRDLQPHQRSLVKAVKKLFGDEVNLSKLRQFQTWSSRYHWVSRANAWDEELDKEARFAQITAVKDMHDRHVKIGKAIQQKAIERLRDLDVTELSPDLILRFIQVGSALERLSLGQPTEITESKNMNVNLEIDYSEMSDDQLREVIARKQLPQ